MIIKFPSVTAAAIKYVPDGDNHHAFVLVVVYEVQVLSMMAMQMLGKLLRPEPSDDDVARRHFAIGRLSDSSDEESEETPSLADDPVAVNAIAWAPEEFGLCLACASSDSHVSVITHQGAATAARLCAPFYAVRCTQS